MLFRLFSQSCFILLKLSFVIYVPWQSKKSQNLVVIGLELILVLFFYFLICFTKTFIIEFLFLFYWLLAIPVVTLDFELNMFGFLFKVLMGACLSSNILTILENVPLKILSQIYHNVLVNQLCLSHILIFLHQSFYNIFWSFFPPWN